MVKISSSEYAIDHRLSRFMWMAQSLKERGFNFEDANLKDEKSLQLLFAVMTITFCWAYHVGAWLNEHKPIRMKKHQRPAKSVFRYGFDLIRNTFFNPVEPKNRNVIIYGRLHVSYHSGCDFVDRLFPHLYGSYISDSFRFFPFRRSVSCRVPFDYPLGQQILDGIPKLLGLDPCTLSLFRIHMSHTTIFTTGHIFFAK